MPYRSEFSRTINEDMCFPPRKRCPILAKVLASILAAVGMAGAVSGQQTSAASAGWAGLLGQLHSHDSEVRSNAFDQLRSDPVALRDSEVKVALVSLLDRENKEPIHFEDEGFAEYASWLSDTVAKIVDWNDPHQVCILANSVDLPDELGDHAKVAIPCLLQRLKTGLNRYASGPDISRGPVVAMLVRASAKGRGQLDAATIQTVRQIILHALGGADEGIKID